jgi:hypothetical protein
MKEKSVQSTEQNVELPEIQEDAVDASKLYHTEESAEKTINQL